MESDALVLSLKHPHYAFTILVSLTLALAGCGGASFKLAGNQPATNGPTGPNAGVGNPTAPGPPSGTPPGTLGGTQPIPEPNPPAGSRSGQTYANIQSAPGWQSCTAKLNGRTCASGRGNAVFSMTPNIQSPSLDGKAAQFSIKGPVGYSNALWWRELGGNNNLHNFVYDLYVYLTQPTAPGSLEFDVNQTLSDKDLKLIFGTECDLQGTHLWHNWDTAHARWQNTSVPCTPFPAYTWNHLVLQFQRTSNDKVLFVSVSINGQTYYFNKQFDPMKVSASELDVAFQMDGNSRQTPYSVWLDKVTLFAW